MLQLRRECDACDWRGAAARSLAGKRPCSAALLGLTRPAVSLLPACHMLLLAARLLPVCHVHLQGPECCLCHITVLLACFLAGPAFEGSLQYELPPERQTVMQQTAASSGQTLRQLAGGEAGPAPADAKTAAAEAALRRAGAPTGAAALGQSSHQSQVFSRGDLVLYTQRDGTQEQAKVGVVCLAVSVTRKQVCGFVCIR